MPKAKKNKKNSSSSGGASLLPKLKQDLTSDADSFSDNASVVSVTGSDNRSVTDDAVDEVDELSQEEIFEEKLKEAIDGSTQKSAQGRTACLEAIVKAFTKKFVPSFVANRRITIMDIVERSLKKGKASEQAAAAHLLVMLCVQLGSYDEALLVIKELRPVLVPIIADPAMPAEARAKCCTSLGLCCFLGGGEMDIILSTMKTFESIFRGSYLKGDGSIPTLSPETCLLHSAAISAWSMLLTVLYPRDTYDIADDCLPNLMQLLQSPSLEVRMAAGEAIALIYEIARQHDEDYEGEDVDNLCEMLKNLATDSHKYRAKKDRRQQKSSFRDILRTVEDYESPSILVKFGGEGLELDSWNRKKQYDGFCQLLGSGMNLHLTENSMLRDIFELGKPVPQLQETLAARKESKSQRQKSNLINCKERNISRQKNRDKKTAVMY